MHSFVRKLAVCVIPVVLLVASGYTARTLREHRHDGMGHSPFAIRNAASVPMVEFVNVALGGFRGIAADILWLRAMRLQEERRFVELAQLSDWITKLEPRLPEVWAYHAHNMGYNISVLMPRAEDRWLWVRNGFELLRDSALPLNPRDATIQRELGWFFQHKIGSDSDRWFAAYYRTRWAAVADRYLAPGGAIPDDSDRTAAALLLENLRMETAVMRAIEARFGRIDWRVPHAQSLYWSWRGLDTATASERLACRRMTYVSLREMAMKHGLLSGDPSSGDYVFAATPNPALLIPAAGFVEETMREHRFGGVRNFYIGLCHGGMIVHAAAGDHETGRLFHGKITDFFNDFQLGYPPYEQALTTPVEFTQNLLQRAGFN